MLPRIPPDPHSPLHPYHPTAGMAWAASAPLPWDHVCAHDTWGQTLLPWVLQQGDSCSITRAACVPKFPLFPCARAEAASTELAHSSHRPAAVFLVRKEPSRRGQCTGSRKASSPQPSHVPPGPRCQGCSRTEMACPGSSGRERFRAPMVKGHRPEIEGGGGHCDLSSSR